MKVVKVRIQSGPIGVPPATGKHFALCQSGEQVHHIPSYWLVIMTGSCLLCVGTRFSYTCIPCTCSDKRLSTSCKSWISRVRLPMMVIIICPAKSSWPVSSFRPNWSPIILCGLYLISHPWWYPAVNILPFLVTFLVPWLLSSDSEKKS